MKTYTGGSSFPNVWESRSGKMERSLVARISYRNQGKEEKQNKTNEPHESTTAPKKRFDGALDIMADGRGFRTILLAREYDSRSSRTESSRVTKGPKTFGRECSKGRRDV